MKTVLVALPVLATACGPSFDFDFDLEQGPITGEQGNVTLSFVDGCTGSDPLFGCPERMPTFAIGSQARFVIGSTTGEAEDERRIARARAVSHERGIVSASRDENGLLYVDAWGTGTTTIDLVEGGEVLDTVTVTAAPIAALDSHTTSPVLQLVGAAFPTDVDAYAADGTQLYAHGAVALASLDGLDLESDVSGYFCSSEQFALRGDVAGAAKVTFSANGATTNTPYRLVTREDIDEVLVTPIFATAGASKMTLDATVRIGGQRVHGGPGCDWRIVSSTDPDATLSPAVGNAFSDALITLYTSALLYGNGDVVVECRANAHVVGQVSVHLGA